MEVHSGIKSVREICIVLVRKLIFWQVLLYAGESKGRCGRCQIVGVSHPVVTLQGHLWSNVFQISQNRDMGVFFT